MPAVSHFLEHFDAGRSAPGKTETNDQDQDVEKEIPFMKGYTVFNVEQIKGLPGIYNVNPQALAEKFLLIENAEKSINATGATFRHGGNKAYYSPSPDVIHLPYPQAFKHAESYAATKPP